MATGVRIVTSSGAIAIDEIEIFAAVVPEPTTAVLTLFAMLGVAFRRRRLQL